MLQRVIRRLIACWTVEAGRAVMLLAGIALAMQVQMFAAVPTYTGCYSASSGTINKLALGTSPQKSCNSGDMQVSFSAGDITKISVTGGLTGGGDNGDITISLDPKYSLPQSCPENYIPKWSGTAWGCAADQNTTYTSGTGLSLSGANNAFSILPAYRLPQSCSDGQTPQANGGAWSCVTPVQGTHAYAGYSGDVHLDNNVETTLLTLTVPSGTYVITGKAIIRNGDPDTQIFNCKMYADGVAVDENKALDQETRLGANTTSASGIAQVLSVPLMTWGAVNQTISIACGTYVGEARAKIMAIPVAAIN